MAKNQLKSQLALTRRTVHAAKRHYYTGRPKAINTARSYTGQVNVVRVKGGKPQHDDKGFVDSGCSRHMTGNIAYLLDFKEFDGGYVAFGGGAYGGRITGKGTLKTNSLDFEDDLEAINLKWKLSLLSMRATKYYQRTGKKIFSNANDTAGDDKSKVECYNCHKLGHFTK
ncbi:hypothetical protein Tco_1039415, partial [Tanacetum coccineum]